MLHQLLIGAAVISLSVVFEAVFIVLAVRMLRRLRDWFDGPHATAKLILGVVAITLWMMAAHTIGVWLWAVTFMLLGVFDTLEPALYFSIVAFTTLGFGDIIVDEPWRLLSGLSAANGLLIFGVSAAFLVEFLARLLGREEEEENPKDNGV